MLDDYDIQDDEVHVVQWYYYSRPDLGNTYELTDMPWYNVKTSTYNWSNNYFDYNSYKTDQFRLTFQIRNDTEALFSQAETALLNFSGLTHYVTTGTGEISYFNPEGITRIDVFGYNTNGAAGVLLPNAEVKVTRNFDNTLAINLNSGILDFPISRFQVNLYYDFDATYDLSLSDYVNGNTTYDLTYGFTNFLFNWSYLPASSSVTGQIKETVTEVKEEIIALPDKIGDAVGGVMNDALVPDSDSVSEQQDKWNQLLSDRFGALYQVGDLVTDYAAAFVESEQNTIDIPTVTIPLGEVDFTFGGWTVQVVPDGFEVVISALKLIVSIACTFLFVNGLKRRFEGLLGGAPTA